MFCCQCTAPTPLKYSLNFSRIADPSIVGLPIAFDIVIRLSDGKQRVSVLLNDDSDGLGTFSSRIRLCRIQEAIMILSILSGVV